MSNPWAKSFEDLRAPYLSEKKAKKDYDGDGKIESGTDEYMGSKDKAIKKAMAMKGKKKVAEHHQKDKDGNTIPHGDGTPSSVEEMKKFGPGGDPVKKPGFLNKALDKLKKNTPVKKIDKAHYEPEGDVVSEEDKKGSGSGKKDACYKKVKASASVWPSAYASGRLVQCRKKGAANYGNSKKEEFDFRIKSFDDMVGECWKTHKQEGTKMKGGKVVPNCVPKNEEAQVDEGAPYTVNVADKLGNTPAYQNFKKGMKNKLDGKPLYKAGVGLDKADYNWKEEVFIEALKGKKLDIKETGVKNKIQINPEVKSEEAKAPVKK